MATTTTPVNTPLCSHARGCLNVPRYIITAGARALSWSPAVEFTSPRGGGFQRRGIHLTKMNHVFSDTSIRKYERTASCESPLRGDASESAGVAVPLQHPRILLGLIEDRGVSRFARRCVMRRKGRFVYRITLVRYEPRVIAIIFNAARGNAPGTFLPLFISPGFTVGEQSIFARRVDR